jgi:molybdopterin/thiamine biosynthesis adenylyltransferase
MKPEEFRTNPVPQEKWDELNYNQNKIYGFYLRIYQALRVLLIGAGAIATHVAMALVRKGIGWLDMYDGDVVELKNLTRQLFSIEDEGKNKAICLARILSKQGFFKTTLTGYPYRFQEALEMGTDFSTYNAVICAVDNNPTRIAAAKYCLDKKIPLIISAVSRDGDLMYCAIQEPDKACFGCIMPHAINDNTYPCNLPGIIDIIQVVSGFTVYALDTIAMGRYREWNIKMVSLDGSHPDSSVVVESKAECALCGKAVQEPIAM